MKTLSIEALEALFWGLTGLVILLTAGRFLMHWQRFGKIRADDIFNGLAVVFLIAFMVTWQRYVPIELPAQLYEAGVIDTPPPDYDPIDALKNDFANLVVFWCCLYCVKASFLALYWQIFEVSRSFRITWYILASYIGISFLVTLLSVFWHCGVPTNHDLTSLESCKRWKPRAIIILYIGAVLHIVGDLFLMALPITMLRKLKMRLSEKIGLCFVFAIVLVDVLFAVLRVVFTLESVYSTAADKNTLWTTLDPIMAVLICTMPCYRHVLLGERTKSIVRTANLSFHWSTFKSTFKSGSAGTKKSASQSTEMDEFDRDRSTDQLPMHRVYSGGDTWKY